MIRVIGIGSPFGDDGAGLAVARLLESARRPGVEVVGADRPGTALLDLLDGADAVILIDAVRSGADPGALHDLALEELLDGAEAVLSSHSFGVAAALALARRLSRMPGRGRFIGVEASARSPLANDEMCPAVAAGVASAVRRVRYWVRRFER